MGLCPNSMHCYCPYRIRFGPNKNTDQYAVLKSPVPARRSMLHLLPSLSLITCFSPDIVPLTSLSLCSASWLKLSYAFLACCISAFRAAGCASKVMLVLETKLCVLISQPSQRGENVLLYSDLSTLLAEDWTSPTHASHEF